MAKDPSPACPATVLIINNIHAVPLVTLMMLTRVVSSGQAVPCGDKASHSVSVAREGVFTTTRRHIPNLDALIGYRMSHSLLAIAERDKASHSAIVAPKGVFTTTRRHIPNLDALIV